MNLPFVSVVIPCRNEEKFIGGCLDSVIANDYPKNRIEVLVVDGMSEDGTRDTLGKYTRKYPFIGLLDNLKKNTPCALNIGIKNAQGDVIMRMDVHTTYEKNYISKCVKYLNEYDADNVGGRMLTLPRNDTFVGKAIVHSLSSRFGVGNSVFRTGAKGHKSVDTVFGGCYKRDVFTKIGLFNEDLSRTQDMEFNLRLKRAGGKILSFPDIISCYYAYSDFKSFCKNNFVNGAWAIYPFKFTANMPVSWRHLVPLAFVSSLMGTAALSVFSQIFLWFFTFILGLYFLVNVYFAGKIARKERSFRVLPVMLLIFATLHISYGLGSAWGVVKVLCSRQFWRNRAIGPFIRQGEMA